MKNENSRFEQLPKAYAEVSDPNFPSPLLAHTKKKLAKWKTGPHRDAVSIIKAMSDAEIHGDSQICMSCYVMSCGVICFFSFAYS